jgi:NifU-like protein
MWDYTEKVKDHFFNPRNVGEIENPDGMGEVGSIACGDALTLMFKLDEKKERIVDVKFKTFGCASAIASSSALTEMIIGKTLDEALKITNKDIADFLGGLPDQKMHCSVMGQEALGAAIDNFRTGKTGMREVHEDVVCICFGVTRDVIERVVSENNLTTAEEVTNYTKAGGGCGSCVEDIEKIIAQVRGAAPNAGQPKTEKKLTNLQRMKLIQQTIDSDIRPKLQADGGDVELVDIDGARVIVQLQGACSSCIVAQSTLRDVVEATLRQAVSSEIIVVEQKG